VNRFQTWHTVEKALLACPRGLAVLQTAAEMQDVGDIPTTTEIFERM